jgi:hypothetical protein
VIGVINKFHHLACANFKNIESEADLSGWDSLKPEDQEIAKAEVFGNSGSALKRKFGVTEPALEEKDLKKLKVPELKKELSDRGLDKTGKKKEVGSTLCVCFY